MRERNVKGERERDKEGENGGYSLRICELGEREGKRERERRDISKTLVVMLGKGHLLVTETNRTGYVPGGGSAARKGRLLRVSSS